MPSAMLKNSSKKFQCLRPDLYLYGRRPFTRYENWIWKSAKTDLLGNAPFWNSWMLWWRMVSVPKLMALHNSDDSSLKFEVEQPRPQRKLGEENFLVKASFDGWVKVPCRFSPLRLKIWSRGPAPVQRVAREEMHLIPLKSGLLFIVIIHPNRGYLLKLHSITTVFRVLLCLCKLALSYFSTCLDIILSAGFNSWHFRWCDPLAIQQFAESCRWPKNCTKSWQRPTQVRCSVRSRGHSFNTMQLWQRNHDTLTYPLNH